MQDVPQETNLALFAKAAEYDVQRPFLARAIRFARFQAMAWRKRQSRDRLVLDEGLFEIVADRLTQDAVVSNRRLDALEACMGRLPEAARDLVDARYLRSGGVGKLPRNEVRAPRRVSRFPRLSRAGWLRVAAAAAGVCVLGAWRSGVWEAAKEPRREAFQSASQWFWPGTQIQCLELKEPVFSAPAQATLLEGESSRVHMLRMKTGAARVRLESGAVMSWTGAVTLEFVSSMHVRVHDG